jgi:hypothetical protein
MTTQAIKVYRAAKITFRNDQRFMTEYIIFRFGAADIFQLRLFLDPLANR